MRNRWKCKFYHGRRGGIYVYKPANKKIKVFKKSTCNFARGVIIYFLRQRDAKDAPLAQLVEHLTLNQGVQGSSPWRCTTADNRKIIGFFVVTRQKRNLIPEDQVRGSGDSIQSI